jgi:hypothetical protein
MITKEQRIEAMKGVPASLFASQRILKSLAPQFKLAGLGNLLGDCGIRGKAATDSGGRRPPIPIESGHPIRTKAATLLIG